MAQPSITELAEAYRELSSYNKVALKFGLPHMFTRRLLKGAGVLRSKGEAARQRKRGPRSPDLELAIVRLYRTGLSQWAVAGKLGTTQSRVWRALIRQSEPRRSLKEARKARPPSARKKLRDQAIIRIYRRGLSAYAVAPLVNLTPSHVAKILRRAGEIRPLREALRLRPSRGWTYVNKNGYRYVGISDLKKRHRAWLAHRLIAEWFTVERKLRRDEDVHHENEDRASNSPRNLKVMPKAEHTRLHQQLKKSLAH